MSIIAVICARDEEKRLRPTLMALRNQSMPVLFVVLVDDGSLDRTKDIASECDCIVVSSPRHEESYVGYLKMATIWNKGLDEARKLRPDYVLLMGADHALPATYLERLLHKTHGDERLMICSGWISGEPFDVDAPRGSGRLVNARFWKAVNGMQYPVCYGWESWLVHKAQQLGFKVACFEDVVSHVSRTTASHNKRLIPMMYSLGYPWVYSMLRCVLALKRNPFDLFKILSGLSVLSSIEKVDNADFINGVKKREMIRKIRSLITRS